jgi:hypothetical protein
MFSLEEILMKLDRLNKTKQPQWGTMSAQRMVEHLSDSFRMASGKISFPMEVPASALDKMQAFLNSDKPMAKNIQVAFAPDNAALRNEELELAIDEFAEEWIDFIDTFEAHSTKTTCHPYYGELSFNQWMQLHKKHVLHHFEQFELINV